MRLQLRPMLLLVMGALAPALAACGQEAAPPPKPLVRVRAATAVPTQYAPLLSLTGVIAARIEDDLSFQTGGRVAERLVDVGDHVEAGQVLARIDPAEQQSDIRSAQAAVAAAQAQVTQTQMAFERQQSLLDRGFTTRSDFDGAQQAARVAKSTLDAAESQLRNAEDALSHTELKATAAGIVTARRVEAGQVVQATQSIYTVAQDGGRDAVFNISEELAATPPPRQDVAITLLSDPRVTAMGSVREVSPVVDPVYGTIRVKVGIRDTPPAMQLGASVVGSVRLHPSEATILPWQALFSDRGQPAVWTIDRGSGRVALHRVEVLAYDTGTVAIRNGLDRGVQVVVAGGQMLRPGLAVEIAEGPEK